MALPPLDPKTRKNLIYGALLLAVVTGFAYMQFYSPRQAENAELETQLAAIQQANSRARGLTRGATSPEEALELFRRQLAVVEGLIPSSEELPDLLDAISAEAQRTGVEISLIQPVSATEERYYTKRIYDMAVLGQYHDIGEFLTRVASLPRIVTPVDLRLATPANAPAAAAAAQRGTPGVEGPPKLEARFSIETYVIPSAPLRDAKAE
ncbi:type 4a pilus biogenesis protein PilO [Longimicrobium sp.]|uniref:type 4a pilus biogenesis protein PilO n=1 Tax=Longimicrobium sp. TaxID=2029185 RepID=UPI002BB8195E|nr:type 4a pilus biogenesis protein PilO [Longimicrobium sp.]HSU13199.1 type 4a pilus biogenesis protein PilO [Longimicrobium sp.]